jgi:hypothetical protein
VDLLDVATGTSAIERLLRLAVDLLDVVAETSAIERLLRLAVELRRVMGCGVAKATERGSELDVSWAAACRRRRRGAPNSTCHGLRRVEGDGKGLRTRRHGLRRVEGGGEGLRTCRVMGCGVSKAAERGSIEDDEDREPTGDARG